MLINWTYRVSKQTLKDGDVVFAIREFYPSEVTEELNSWTADAIAPIGDSIDGLRWVLNRMVEVKMMNNIGLCGAHRTGKTTLAIALSKKINMPFAEIGTSKLFGDRNLDPAKPMDFRTRLHIQRIILNHAETIWFEMDESFICDRTPIDMAAYTLAEVQGNTLNKEIEWELQDYLRDCQEVTERYFGYLFLIPPAIPIIDAIGKASPSRGYIEHIHTLCLGLFHQSHVNGYCIEKDVKILSARVADIKRFLGV